eukprot:scaffold310214_cov17-Prasinocladus_malaysianus.AAC.1
MRRDNQNDVEWNAIGWDAMGWDGIGWDEMRRDEQNGEEWNGRGDLGGFKLKGLTHWKTAKCLSKRG